MSTDDDFEKYGCGFMLGMFIMGIIMRICFGVIPEFYGDICLNSPDYRIDTVYIYNKDYHINTTEYKFIKKK